MAGLIVVGAGLVFIAVRELQIPRYWIPVIVGAALSVAGALRWLTTRRDP